MLLELKGKIIFTLTSNSVIEPDCRGIDWAKLTDRTILILESPILFMKSINSLDWQQIVKKFGHESNVMGDVFYYISYCAVHSECISWPNISQLLNPDTLYVVQKLWSTDFQAPKLWNVRSGGNRVHICCSNVMDLKKCPISMFCKHN